ncbi:MAG: TraB/GumN family protein [Kofleriaceae bacterium]
MKRILMCALVVVVAGLGTTGCKSSPPEAKPPVGSASLTPPPAEPARASQGSAAASNDPWTAPKTKKDPLAHPLFWSIEKDGRTSYALGTMHMGVDAESRLPQIVFDKLDASPTFAMETDISDPALANIASCNNCSLRRDLSKKQYETLEKALSPAMVAQFDKLKPMIATVALTVRMYTPTAPMDGVLFGRATNQNKRIVYLEPASVQVAALTKWADLRALKATLDDLEDSDRIATELFEAYVSGDEAKMIEIDKQVRAEALEHGYTPAEYEAQMNDLLFKRNASWIAPIEKLHADGGGFIAVGAMHLVGPKNVLELLSKKGYKITRITP